MARLCVNIDHVATLRQARGGIEPSVLSAAAICEKSGAHGITVHLREDRRHIQDQDVIDLKKEVKGTFNLEMALSDDVIAVAKTICPDQITIVPEKRQELTTEGGLNVNNDFDRLKSVISEFVAIGVTVSLFIEPNIETIELSQKAGAQYIELHTGTYCEAFGKDDYSYELDRIFAAAQYAKKIGMGLNAGHGLNIFNIAPILPIENIHEFNIGHSIVSRSVFLGLENAVKEFISVINNKI
jgi:pyridoxine 5-phosphate synthase